MPLQSEEMILNGESYDPIRAGDNKRLRDHISRQLLPESDSVLICIFAYWNLNCLCPNNSPPTNDILYSE